MSDSYLRQRQVYQDVSGNAIFATGDTTIASGLAGKTSETIYLQKVHVEVITASSSKTLTVKDTNGTPLVVSSAIDLGTAGPATIDYGPIGVPLTEGKGLSLILSAAGAAGVITWEAYRKLTAVAAPA